MDFFDTDLIIARLKETQFGFDVVEGAAEYAAVERLSSFRPGSLYVVLLQEQNAAGDNPQPRSKAVATVTFGVVAAARNYNGNTGAAAMKDAKPIIGRLRQALIGWAPAGCSTPCRWLHGELRDYDKSTLLWVDIFTTTHVLSS